MDRRSLTEEDRALLRALLNEHMARGVAGIMFGGENRWSPETCFRLLKKIDGPDKVLYVESTRLETLDAAARKAEDRGCG